MAVDNTTIGSVLTIPDGLLKNLEKVDEKLENIQKKARETEKEFNASFQGMNTELAAFLPNLQKIVTALGGAAKHSKAMGESIGSAVDGVNKLNGSITAAIEVINKMRTLVQTPTSGGSFMSHVSTLVDAISVRVSGMGVKFKDFKRQLLELDTAAMQKAMKAQSDAKIKLMNEQTATTLAKVNLEQSKQNRLYAQAATEAAKLARAQAQLAQAQAMAATAQERATAANERAARRATIRQYGANATSAMSYVNDPTNTGTFNQRAIAIKVLEEAIKNLNKTDKDYQKNLQDLSNRYRELKSEQDRVVSSYREMQQHHRSLMDTTGQLQRAFALMFSVSQIRGYINQIAQVRGEFELQQRSLEAILQNKTEADAIFNKTVALAVQSPFQIKDLISYTKQLAAYRIESDKLYDTTKRLADVSAGLGVDMQRLILAYGQVKAAAYLRGTEVRQFTEAGINLYGELQAYFKEVKGEAYTTAQIVDMISKRMVTFEDVDAIFKRITDQGGIFYNMQAIQAETLQGKIANLKDSIDVMLNSIGYANEGMYKFAIDGANVMIRNWQLLADVGLRLVEVLALITLHSVTTGKAMGATFLDIAKFQKLEGIKNTVGLLSVSFKNFGRALYAAGVMAKAAMAQFLPLLLLMEVWQVISRIIDVNTEYNKTIRESTQAYADETAKINKVVNSIKDLQKAREDAIKSKDKDFDFKQNWDMQKSNLQTLYDRLKQEKLEVPLEISKVTQENIDSVIADAQQKLQLGYQMIADTQRELANSNSSFFFGNGQGLQSFLPDNFDTDMNDLENAAADVRAYATQIQASIALVGEQYKHLDDVSKKAYDNIKNGARKGEVDVNYVIRAYDELERILNGYAASNPMLEASRQQFNDYAHSIMGLKTQIEGIWQFNSQKETATKQLQDLFDSLDGIYGARLAKMKPAEVKVEWNKVATAAKLQDLERYILLTIAAKKYKFKVEGDEEDLAKQLNWVDDYIRKFFAGRKYSATVSLQTNTDAMEDFLNKGDAEAKTAQIAKKFVDRFSKSVNKNAKKLKVDEKIRNLFSGSNVEYVLGDEIDAKTVLARAKEILAKATDLAKNGYGVDPFDKNGNKTAKAQRDILSEQIDLIEKMASKYEELRKYKSAAESVDALKQYYAENIKYSKLDADIIDQLLGMDGGIDMAKVSAWIRKLSLQFKEQTKKMGGLAKAADIDARVEVKIDSESLDAAKREVDDAFSGLNAYTDLKKLGLSDEDIKKMFGNLPKTYEDVRKQIDETFAGKEGESWTKQREDAEKKLQEQVVKNNLNTFKELTKAYKTQLSDQLQLDAWYAEERRKIEESEELKKDPKLKAEFIQNLKKKYDKQTDLNTWNAFKETEDYIRIFENLDYSSTEAIGRVLDNLENMRESLKDLPPEQLKVIVELIEKLKREKLERNPIKGIVNALKDLKEADPEDKQHALADLGAAISYLGECVGEFNSAFGEMSTMLASFGVDVPEEISGALGGLSQAFEGAGEFATAYATKDPIGMLTSGMKTLSGLGNTVANVFGFGNKDKKLQKQIEEQEKAVQRLQRAYEKLKQSMEDAYAATDLNQSTGDAIANLRQQNASLEKMIATENDKKDTDPEKIQQWLDQIEDNKDTIEELLRRQTEEMGGFGNKANYKSAAQEFADAWVDAFNEGSDTLEALQDKMDDYFDNLLKKQLMQRAAGKYFEAVFKAFDDAVAEGSAGGANGLEVTKEELDKIKEIAATQSGLFDEYAKGLMEILGVSPQSSTTLSQLQQGIQSLSESTGQALESLLNSIRFFVAQQSTDVAAIRQLLSATSNIEVSNTDNSPMLRELQTQTAYLSKMYSLWSSVIKSGGHPKNGAGIKVFQD
ncbi:MAG: tape measure protein [Prevotella sp.]